MDNKKLIDHQLELMHQIQQVANVNIVTCGDCGSVVLHQTKAEEITCPYCNFTNEPCHFPDLLHEGMNVTQSNNQ